MSAVFALIAYLWSMTVLPEGPTPKTLTGKESLQPLPPSDPGRTVELPVGREASTRTAPLEKKPDSASERSFETTVDLYALAVRNASSADRRALLHAVSAIDVCIDADIHQERVGHLINTRPFDPKQREVARSATILLSRCRGFINNDLVAIHALRKELWGKLRQTGEYAPGVSEREMTAADFRKIVDERDWLSFEYGLRLVTKARVMNNQPSVDDALFGIAYTAAACDLGKECGSESVTYAAYCLRSGDCQGSWEKTFAGGLSDQQTAKVRKYRNEIARAIEMKNYAYFGS